MLTLLVHLRSTPGHSSAAAARQTRLPSNEVRGRFPRSRARHLANV